MSIAHGRFFILSLLVAFAAGLLFTPGLPGEFLFDDGPNITTNEAVHLTELSVESLSKVLATPQLSGITRALPTLSFALDYWRAGGPDPMVFKTTNIVIHALTACALAWFFRSLLLLAGVPGDRVRWLAPALALAWALHPLQVSSVLYTVQRIQTMGTLFLVLALWAYLRGRQAQIAGHHARTSFLLGGLAWALAMGCKEDSALLPAYTLALELTVLQFAAKHHRTTTLLRRGYLLSVLAAAAVYVLVVVPHYWQWEAYQGRDYSTPERLLTQARVLCMYIWQIVVPLPQHMPFYYDWLQPSRGLLQPWTTLPAVALIIGLLGVAWRLRNRWPLLSLGIFLFFSAHFITSNVVGLELVFEHRNHFALIGAVLAVGSVLAYAGQRLQLHFKSQATACVILLAALGSTTALRDRIWSSTENIARLATESAPGSGRAWTQLCASQFTDGGGAVIPNPRLDEAIETCIAGAAAVPESLNSLTLLIVLKSLRGDATREDWSRLQERIQTVPMTLDNARIFLTLTYHARKEVKLNRQELFETLDILEQQDGLGPFNLAYIGYFIMNDMEEPDLALPYFVKAINVTAPNDPFPRVLATELREINRPDLAKKIEEVALARLRATAAGG